MTKVNKHSKNKIVESLISYIILDVEFEAFNEIKEFEYGPEYYDEIGNADMGDLLKKEWNKDSNFFADYVDKIVSDNVRIAFSITNRIEGYFDTFGIKSNTIKKEVTDFFRLPFLPNYATETRVNLYTPIIIQKIKNHLLNNTSPFEVYDIRDEEDSDDCRYNETSKNYFEFPLNKLIIANTYQVKGFEGCFKDVFERFLEFDYLDKAKINYTI